LAQNPESNRIVNASVAPARRTPATSSSMNRRAPRWVFADPAALALALAFGVAATAVGHAHFRRVDITD